jgi:hypothetical protein
MTQLIISLYRSTAGFSVDVGLRPRRTVILYFNNNGYILRLQSGILLPVGRTFLVYFRGKSFLEPLHPSPSVLLTAELYSGKVILKHDPSSPIKSSSLSRTPDPSHTATRAR